MCYGWGCYIYIFFVGSMEFLEFYGDDGNIWGF